MPQHLLEGTIDNRDAIIEALQADNERMRKETLALQVEVSQLKTANTRGISNLRRQLSPLYEALRQVFGEMDAIGGGEESAPAGNAQNLTMWQAWKSRLGLTAGKVIDALLTHGELNTQQLAITTGLHRTTIPKAVYDLNKAGLINKAAGRFSLKELKGK